MEAKRLDSRYVLEIKFTGLHIQWGKKKIERMKPRVLSWQLHLFRSSLSQQKLTRAGLIGWWKIKSAI